MNGEHYGVDRESQHVSMYGTPRHSGRYPWGSGDNPYQHEENFLKQVNELKKQGMSEVDISRAFGLKTGDLRKRISESNTKLREYRDREIFRLYDKGLAKSAIARRFETGESTIRSIIAARTARRSASTTEVANVLRDMVDRKKMVDVGLGAEQYLGNNVSKTKLDNAIHILKNEGYTLEKVYTRQPSGNDTTITVLATPDIDKTFINKHRDEIQLPSDYYHDSDKDIFKKVEPPRPLDSKRVYIRYNGEGGEDKDGLIELRRGVDDISLKDAKYAQVRINVDDIGYMKGMAMYSDNIPEGYDIVYNTHKKRGARVMPESPDDKEAVFKPLDKTNKENPFGASYRQFDDQLILCQRHYTDKNGKEQLSCLNVVNEEGDWDKWSRTLAAQMLSKQPPSLAKQQLAVSYSVAKDELDTLKSLTNPTVKAMLLDKFASQCDSDATHLQAAALPRQATKVLLPFSSIKDNEIYSPNLDDGTTVALIRYPHAGTFEIPVLTVNNKRREPKEAIQNAKDAVGRNAKVASRLSGADFDGDSALVIPIDNVNFRSTKPLAGLIGFDPQEAYPGYPGMKKMTKRERGLEMGMVTNLITDMQIKGAKPEEVERAVKHSMVVIDAYKHGLDFRSSEKDNRIAELKTKYQGGPKAGASTLISRSTSEVRVPDRMEQYYSRMTPAEKAAWREGKLIFTNTGKTYSKKHVDEDGNVTWTKEPRTQKIYRMMREDDAFNLVSGTPETTTKIERIYANYANQIKALANEARKEARSSDDIQKDPTAVKAYKEEISSLRAKLNIARKNSPLERQALLIANKIIAQKLYDNPNLDEEHKKRIKGQEIDNARRKVHARFGLGKDWKHNIIFTDKEWEAINAGAISKTFLKDLLNYSDLTRVRELATPRNKLILSPAKVSRIRTLYDKGYTQADIARLLDISVSSIEKALAPQSTK